MDEELQALDRELHNAQWEVIALENRLEDLEQTYMETYPHEALDNALEAIRRLTTKLLDLCPQDLEAQDLLQQSEREITEKLEEHSLFS